MKKLSQVSSGRGHTKFVEIILVIFSIIWFLAVIKVFLFEKKRVINNEYILDDDFIASPIKIEKPKKNSPQLRIGDWVPVNAKPDRVQELRDMRQTIKNKESTMKSTELPVDFPPVTSLKLVDSPEVTSLKVVDSPPVISLKLADSPEFTSLKVVDSPPVISLKRETHSSNLVWPPVLPNGEIKEEDGYEIMPFIDLKVPKFWSPPEGMDPVDIHSEINGQPTIFLMIASYRDFQCRETIEIAFERADHPERLFVGAVDQVVDGDIGCLDLEVSCVDKPSQKICKYRDNISIYKMDASLSTGPVTARHIGYRMYRGQEFYMQMDAHCPAVR